MLDIKGDNLSWGAGLSHHFVFSPRSSLKLNGWFEWADMEQEMLGFTTSDDKIRKIRLGADYELKDRLGRTFVSLYLHQGLGHNLGGMPDEHKLSSRSYSGADDNFSKFALGLMRLQSFHPQLYGLLNFNAQYFLDPLVAGEQLYLGGANSVRGQPASVFSGDDGFVVNAELRFSPLASKPSLLQLAAFFDHGEVFLRHPIIGQEKHRGISGAGAGLRSQIFTGLDVRFDVAFPVGVRRGDSVYFYGQLRYSF
ncbi:MAG: BamA/TamA family outer membrane protein [Verrucomicrobiales bacterium]|nr:BamA/TamA family outer membrane protein [Verrucomicrobiales bacterium]